MWRWVKLPIAVAALAFLLPWMSVSIFGKQAMSLSGWQLVNGEVHRAVGPVSVGLHTATAANTYFVIALGLMALALASAFLRRRFAALSVIASLLAMAFIWAGHNQYYGARIEAAASKMGGVLGSLAASQIEIGWLIGYWIAMIALGVAAALALLAIGEARSAR